MQKVTILVITPFTPFLLVGTSCASDLQVVKEKVKIGMSMLVVTYEMGFAEKVGDRVIFMADGVVVEDSEPQEMFSNPKEQRTRQFLAEVLK